MPGSYLKVFGIVQHMNMILFRHWLRRSHVKTVRINFVHNWSLEKLRRSNWLDPRSQNDHGGYFFLGHTVYLGECPNLSVHSQYNFAIPYLYFHSFVPTSLFILYTSKWHAHNSLFHHFTHVLHLIFNWMKNLQVGKIAH
jgi:hypothetical protein